MRGGTLSAEAQKQRIAMAFTQILYVSRIGVPAGERETAKTAILDSARRFNAEHGVTGCLALRGDFFVQVVEGPAAAVDEVMARIRTDPRHDDVEVRLSREVGTRTFPHWRMADIEFDQASTAAGDPLALPAVVLLTELIRLSERAARG
jgi:hypothetical protein